MSGEYTPMYATRTLWISLLSRGCANIMNMQDQFDAVGGLLQLDRQTMGVIYNQYFSEIYRYVRYRVNDGTVAEDIASDVFMRFMEAVQKRQGPQSNIRG